VFHRFLIKLEQTKGWSACILKNSKKIG